MNNYARFITLSVILTLTGIPTIQAGPGDSSRKEQLIREIQDLNRQQKELEKKIVNKYSEIERDWESSLETEPEVEEMVDIEMLRDQRQEELNRINSSG